MGGGGKDQNCSESSETHFGLGLFEIQRKFEIEKNTLFLFHLKGIRFRGHCHLTSTLPNSPPNSICLKTVFLYLQETFVTEVE